MAFKTIRFIINPSSGTNEPILNTINRVLHRHDVRWSVDVTQAGGDAKRMTEQAVQDGVELVAAYGGDGTVTEVAHGLLNHDVPLGLLPGGTGNAMAFKLGVPPTLEHALSLLVSKNQVQAVDMCRVTCCDEHGNNKTGHFILRASIGLANKMLDYATPELKTQFGNMAYVMGAFNSLSNADELNFRLHIGEDTHDIAGVACLVANAATVGGQARFDFAPQVSPSDGQMNTFVFKYQGDSLLNILKSHLNANLSEFPNQWPFQTMRIETESPQLITLDGEKFGYTPATFDVLPAAVKVVVPYTPAET